jgi:chromate transporter
VSAGAWEVGRVFLKLGAVSYGGPAMMGIMQAEIERKRQWVTRERFVEGLALVNFLPGPLAVQLSIVLGYVRAGWLGGVLGGLGFILPGFAIMLALTILYSAYGALPALRGVFYGLSPVVIGIFAVAVYRLGRAAIKDRAQIVIAVASAVLLGLTPLGIVPTVLLAAAAGVTVYASRGWGLATAVVVLGLAIARLWMGPSAAPLLAGTAPLLAGGGEDASALASPGLWRLGAFFFKVGAFTFGNGLPILAIVEDQVVRQFRWLTAQEFIDGLALGQLTPGPIITPLAAFVGYRVAGVAGAVVSAVAIFLPSFILVLAVLPFFAAAEGRLDRRGAERTVARRHRHDDRRARADAAARGARRAHRAPAGGDGGRDDREGHRAATGHGCRRRRRGRGLDDAGLALSRRLYWITWSASSSSGSGTASSRLLAVLRLTASRNRFGSPMGSSPGLAPRRILMS